MSNQREKWGSKLGFILAAAGSAVGIGNIWKYPHMAGQNGGSAFTIIYLICIFLVGLSIVIAEFAIGRKTQLSPVGAFEKLAPGSSWKYVGFLGVASAFVILSFYGVVGGWILKYIIDALTGGFSSLAGNPEASSAMFGAFVESTWSPLIYQLFLIDYLYRVNHTLRIQPFHHQKDVLYSLLYFSTFEWHIFVCLVYF